MQYVCTKQLTEHNLVSALSQLPHVSSAQRVSHMSCGGLGGPHTLLQPWLLYTLFSQLQPGWSSENISHIKSTPLQTLSSKQNQMKTHLYSLLMAGSSRQAAQHLPVFCSPALSVIGSWVWAKFSYFFLKTEKS